MAMRTDKEGILWWDQLNFDGCPYCDCAEMLDGPEAANSQNMKCAKCGAEFVDAGTVGVKLMEWPETGPVELSKTDKSKKQISVSREWVVAVDSLLSCLKHRYGSVMHQIGEYDEIVELGEKARCYSEDKNGR
jgi:hypothetical protein